MALTFPALLSQFFDLLPIQGAQIDLLENYQIDETGNGEVIAASLGERLWQMTVTIREQEYEQAEDTQSLIRMMRREGASFLAYPIPRNYPKNDKGGTTLGSATPKLHSVLGTMRELRISGLPSGYKLGRGDFISFTYGSNPVRYALHQIVSDTVSADGTGLTPVIEVNPELKLGYVIDSDVKLKKPRFKAVIVPGSVTDYKVAQQWGSQMSFTIRQTKG